MEGKTRYYELCIVRSCGEMYPVYMPTGHSLDIGDIVFFGGKEGEVIYETYTACGSDVWNLVVVLLGTSPMMIDKFAHVYDVKPEDYEE